MHAGLYKHYKGGYYQVLGVARHSDTDEKFVVYVSLDVSKPGPRLCVRPYKDFREYVRVQPPSGDDSGNVPRFQHIGDGFPE